MMDIEARIHLVDQEMVSVGEKVPILKRTILSWEELASESNEPAGIEKLKKGLEEELESKINRCRKFEHISGQYFQPSTDQSDEALPLQSQISRLDKPSTRLLRIVSDYLNKPQPIIYGRAQNMLDDPSDLVALRAPLDTDHLSCLIRNYWPFRSKSYPETGDTTKHFLESHVQQVVVGVSTVFAAIFLVGAITSLYFVRKPGAKLGFLPPSRRSLLRVWAA